MQTAKEFKKQVFSYGAATHWSFVFLIVLWVGFSHLAWAAAKDKKSNPRKQKPFSQVLPEPAAPTAIPHPCSDRYELTGLLKIQKNSNIPKLSSLSQINPKLRCSLYISPDNQLSGKYRSFVLSRNGLFLVFNSTKKGAGSAGTGARVYSFFPRDRFQDFEIRNDRIYAATATTGLEFIFDTRTGFLIDAVGVSVSVDPTISSTNNGGVELTKNKFLMIDYGFRNGNDPTTKRNNDNRVTDSFGQTCDLKNKDLFDYNGHSDPEFKFTDAALKAFLTEKCPQLKLEF